MARNVRSHRISYTSLASRGAVAGFLAAIVMGAVAVIGTPLVDDQFDGWSFFKVISTMFVGEDAVQPIAGFDALPVVIGLVMHFLFGTFFGAVFGMLVGLLGIDETVPVTLTGIVYGVAVFIPAYIGIAPLVLPELSQLPTVVILWGHIAFGLIAGAVLGSWADLFDKDQDFEPSPSTRSSGLY